MSRRSLLVVYLLIALGVFAGLGAAWQVGGEGKERHPAIPLAEGGGVDFSACAGCHMDKTEAPVVHAAVSAGCETCHEVDQDDDWTEVFLVSEGNELCTTCHGDKQPQPSQLTLHQPLRRQTCVTCHDAHSSQAPNLLRKPAEGREAAENLCLGCHENIRAQLQKANLHAAVDLGCASCHATHKSLPAESPEGIFHLTEAEPGLCLTCHNSEEEAFPGAHSHQPVASSRCTTCHNPHGSDRPKLVNNVVHGAFELGCETCHAEPQEGKVVLQEGAGRELCLTCHSDLEEQWSKAAVTHAPVEMDSGCIGCHNPHATTYARLLKEGPVRTCFSCHSELAEERASKPHLHTPVFAAGCPVCHQPHSGERPRLLRAATNDLCLECHNEGFSRALEVRIRGGVPMKLFEDKVEVEARLLQGVPTIPLQKGQDKGHPSIGVVHPVAGKYPLGDNMTCVSCHAPHAGRDEKLLATSGTQQGLCSKCH